MKRYVDTAKFREKHPASWNEVWRITKADAPAFANFMRDPFFRECIGTFGATVDLPFDDFPEQARKLIPQDVITH